MISARSRAAWTIRSRCDSTAHAAASYGEWNPHGRNPGSRCLRVGDHRVSPADIDPAARVDVEGQEPGDLVGRRIKVAVAGHGDRRGVSVLGDGGIRARDQSASTR